MGAVTEEGYKPSSDYQENTKDSLVNLNLTDSTELWLMQFPPNLNIDFDNQEVTLNLHHDGKIGSFEGSSGKAYDLVSFSSQGPKATVFASHPSESEIVGKVSRLVSIVHYPEPSELEKTQKQRSLSMSTSSSMMKSSRHSTTPSRSMQRKSMSRSAASTRSSRQKSALSDELGEASKAPKRERGEGSALDSGRVSSGITSSGSQGRSHHKKSRSEVSS